MNPTRLAALLLVTLLATARAQDDPGARGPLSVKNDSIAVATSEGWTIDVTLRLPDKEGPLPLVLIQHGYTHRASFWVPLAEHLASRGFAVAVVDQPNPLEVDPSAWKDRLRLAMDAVLARGGFGDVAVIGHSYGGAAATMLAAEDDRVKTIVAVAAGDLFIFRGKFMKAAAAMKQPLLTVSAETDEIVPTSLFSRPAWERASGSRQKLFLEVAGAGHLRFADVPLLPGGEAQRATLARHATAWLEGQLGLRDDRAEWLDGTAAERERAAGVLSDVRRPPPPPSKTKGVVSALGD